MSLLIFEPFGAEDFTISEEARFKAVNVDPAHDTEELRQILKNYLSLLADKSRT